MRVPDFDRHAAAAAVTTAAVVLVCALVFPNTPASGVAALIVVAAMGAAAMWAVDHLRGRARPAPPWSGPLAAYVLVLLAAYLVFEVPWDWGLGWNLRDWGPNHALVADLLRHLEAGTSAPRWVHGVSTGDAPYELYPALTSYAAAYLAMALGESDIPFLLGRIAIAVHVLLAVGAVRLTLRVAPWPLAALAGIAVLFDRGKLSSGGSSAILYWGLLHSTAAVCLWTFTLAAIIDALRRPRLGTSVQIWVVGALGIAAHPVGLVIAAGAAIALAGVAVLARDVPLRRSLVALAHVGIAVALAAVVWAPLAARLLAHGVNYGTSPEATWKMFRYLVSHGLPYMSYAAVVFAGYAGAIAALVSRRAAPTFVAALAGVFLLGFSDQLYVLLDLAPTPATARMSALRLLTFAKIPLVASAAYLATVLAATIATKWRGRARLGAGAVAALLVAVFLRGALPWADVHTEVIRADLANEVEDPEGFEELIAWGAARAGEMTPQTWGRLLYERDANFVYHVHAVTGLPTLWVGATSSYLLRDRIEEASPEELRRFNVRWVARLGRSPNRGDPATEVVVGGHHIRELDGWDGRFARVESGGGRAVVSRLDDRSVIVDLVDTDTPSLVALGTGYYPRWRARTADGTQVPVYALPSTPGAALHVVAAWVPPGRVEFTPDGSLPSDGDGLALSVLTALLAIAIIVTWSWPRARVAVLRRAAVLLARARRHRRVATLAMAWIAGLALVVSAVAAERAPANALGVGNGLTGDAEVRARVAGGAWRDCAYSAARGSYRCADLVHVEDSMKGIIHDHGPGFGLVTPVIRAWRETDEPVEIEIRLEARLDGAYRTETEGGRFEIALDGAPGKVISANAPPTYPDDDIVHDVVITGNVGSRSASIAFVREDAVDPERRYPAPPKRPPPGLAGPDDL